MNYKNEKNAAVEAVVKACALCREVQGDIMSAESLTKDDRSPVTIADYGAQAIVSNHLVSLFDYPLVGEEDSSYLKTEEGKAVRDGVLERLNKYLPGLSEDQIIKTIDRGNYNGGQKGKFWTLDPIDGTKGFLRNDQYAVALALIDKGEVVLGVLGCPNLGLNKIELSNTGCLLVAERGSGAYIKSLDNENYREIKVANTNSPSESLFCESVESSHSSHDDSRKIAQLLNVNSEPVRIDSQCKYAVLARGDASIYLRLPTSATYREKIWDHAAGSIIVEEAGGVVTDCSGNKLDFSLGTTLKSNTGIIATNGRFHREVLEAVATVLA